VAGIYAFGSIDCPKDSIGQEKKLKGCQKKPDSLIINLN